MPKTLGFHVVPFANTLFWTIFWDLDIYKKWNRNNLILNERSNRLILCGFRYIYIGPQIKSKDWISHTSSTSLFIYEIYLYIIIYDISGLSMLVSLQARGFQRLRMAFSTGQYACARLLTIVRSLNLSQSACLRLDKLQTMCQCSLNPCKINSIQHWHICHQKFSSFTKS